MDSPASAAPVLDPEAIAALEESIPADVLQALVIEYLESVRLRLHCIQDLVIRGDLETLAQEAHDLISTAGTFGARRVQSLASQLENACRQRRADDVARVAAKIGPVAALASHAVRVRFRVE